MIPNKNFSKEDLYKFILQNKVYSGGEAIICESDNPYTLYKVFSKFGDLIPMSENKIKKLQLLYEKDLDYMVKPIITISCNDMIVGYEMTSDYSFNTYKHYQLTKEELIEFLEQTKSILEYFQDNNIIYGDINFRNILLNRNNMDILFCDIDNIQIDDYFMDVVPYDLINYETSNGIDSSVHAYMHNIMTLKAFNLDMYCSSNFVINKHFKRGARKVILSMQEENKFNSEYLISYIKKHK